MANNTSQPKGNQPNQPKGPKFSMNWFYILVMAALLGAYMFGGDKTTDSSISKPATYTEFQKYVKEGYVQSITINNVEHELELHLKPEKIREIFKQPAKQTGKDGLPLPPYKVYNIGNSSPENLLDFVQILQEELIAAGVLPADYDFEAHKELVPMQAGDVPVTFADTSALERDFGFKPSTTLRQGLRAFAQWYKEFYK